MRRSRGEPVLSGLLASGRWLPGSCPGVQALPGPTCGFLQDNCSHGCKDSDRHFWSTGYLLHPIYTQGFLWWWHDGWCHCVPRRDVPDGNLQIAVTLLLLLLPLLLLPLSAPACCRCCFCCVVRLLRLPSLLLCLPLRLLLRGRGWVGLWVGGRAGGKEGCYRHAMESACPG